MRDATPLRSCLLSMAALLLLPQAHAQGAPDFSKVEIKTNTIANGFYTLDGQGGTIGVLTGPDGVFMVDTQFAPLGPKIEAAIRRLSTQPIRYVVDTHVHGDHTGGNEYFGHLGATIIARPELRDRLMHPATIGNTAPPPTAAVGLPRLVYTNALTLYFDGQEIRLIAVPRAHTDGDTLVYFPGLDVIMCGDFFRAIQYPNIDRANGGSLQGILDGLGLLVGRAGPATKIIPGHGPVVDRTAVMTQRDLILTVRERVAALLAQGKSEDDVVAAKVTADLDARVQQPGTTADRFVRQVYQELAAAR
jgi:glyoxylase-like metal-dependent hydrolase (beta-lactamase superfamily II)